MATLAVQGHEYLISCLRDQREIKPVWAYRYTVIPDTSCDRMQRELWGVMQSHRASCWTNVKAGRCDMASGTIELSSRS